MTPHQKGSLLDNEILKTIEDWRVVNSKIIHCLHYRNSKSGVRIAQNKLSKLYKKGKIVRWWNDEGGGYCYGFEKPGRSSHTFLLNQVRLWYYLKGGRPYSKYHCFLYEQNYGILKADGFAAVKNYVTGEFHFIFIEMDRNSTRNKFDKILKYNRLFETGITDRWWLPLAKGFPDILIVTMTEERRAKILEHIKEENTVKDDKGQHLNFEVKLLKEVIV